MEKLNLNENDFKKWKNQQLSGKLFLKKIIDDKYEKDNVQLTKWKSAKNEMKKLNLNENDFKKWTNQQLRAKLVLKKIIDDKPLPITKDNLKKLWDE